MDGGCAENAIRPLAAAADANGLVSSLIRVIRRRYDRRLTRHPRLALAQDSVRRAILQVAQERLDPFNV